MAEVLDTGRAAVEANVVESPDSPSIGTIVMRRRNRRWAVLAAGTMLAASACVTRVESPGATPRAADTDPMLAGTLVVEQFLRAVNATDLDTMGRLFGTSQGPIVRLYDRKHVDDRMLAIASILRHEDYTIQGTGPVPGRRDPATQVIVRMKVSGREADVPYTLVWSDARNWLIEQIDLERVTRR